MRRLLVAAAAGLLLCGCVVVTEPQREPEGSVPGREGAGNSPGGYDFLHTRDNGAPVRWSTCEPIRYVVRTKNQPDGAQQLLGQSIRRIASITGLEFSHEGTTTEPPRTRRPPYQPDRYGNRWAPVLIAYSGPKEYERLRGQAVGYGGAAYVQSAGARARYVSGMAVFDADQMAELGGRSSMRAVILHELAHVVGLGHVNDRGQLMNPVQYGREVTQLQGGDIAGLEALGKGKCYEPVEPSGVR